MKAGTMIRFAEKGDMKRLVELCDLHAQYENSPYSLAGKEQRLMEQLFSNVPPIYCLVAVVNQEIIGYATYMKQFSTWDAGFYIYMDCLFLIDESRGFGIGLKLLEFIKEDTIRLGCDQIQWQTPDFNKRAMIFYNRLGGVSKSKERYFLNIQTHEN